MCFFLQSVEESGLHYVAERDEAAEESSREIRVLAVLGKKARKLHHGPVGKSNCWKEAMEYLRTIPWPETSVLFALIAMGPKELGPLAHQKAPIINWEDVSSISVQRICRELTDYYMLPSLEYIQSGQLDQRDWENCYWITVRKDPSEPSKKEEHPLKEAQPRELARTR